MADDRKSSDQELVARLVEQARADGAELVGQNGLLPARSAQVINGYLANLINRDIG